MDVVRERLESLEKILRSEKMVLLDSNVLMHVAVLDKGLLPPKSFVQDPRKLVQWEEHMRIMSAYLDGLGKFLAQYNNIVVVYTVATEFGFSSQTFHHELAEIEKNMRAHCECEDYQRANDSLSLFRAMDSLLKIVDARVERRVSYVQDLPEQAVSQALVSGFGYLKRNFNIGHKKETRKTDEQIVARALSRLMVEDEDSAIVSTDGFIGEIINYIRVISSVLRNSAGVFRDIRWDEISWYPSYYGGHIFKKKEFDSDLSDYYFRIRAHPNGAEVSKIFLDSINNQFFRHFKK